MTSVHANMTKARLILKEFGWPDADTIVASDKYITGFGFNPVRQVPRAIQWMVGFALGFPNACWACVSENDQEVLDRCFKGHCSNPGGPKVPPKELLQPRRIK